MLNKICLIGANMKILLISYLASQDVFVLDSAYCIQFFLFG